MQDKLKRLRYLWTWELFDSFFLPAVVIFCAYVTQNPLGLFSLYSMACVTFLLWQGAAYWYLKLAATRDDSPIKPAYLGWFARLKWVNWALLALLPLVLGLQVWQGTRLDFNLIAGASLYGLAFLEQVNYYHYQLMYDYGPDWRALRREKRLKKASLRRALERQEQS